MAKTYSVEFGRGARLNALTSLRFFAAFAIVIHHSRIFLLPSETLSAWPLDQGVSLFFVLSGFILVHVYPELPTKEAIKSFWLARIGRIWPAHLVALILVLTVSGTQTLGGDSLLIFLANLSMIHGWVPSREFFFSFNALSWTISTELGFYALFPLLIYKFHSTWASVSDARASIGRYLNFYNGRRPHSSLDDKTPDQTYFIPLPLRTAA